LNQTNNICLIHQTIFTKTTSLQHILYITNLHDGQHRTAQKVSSTSHIHTNTFWWNWGFLHNFE